MRALKVATSVATVGVAMALVVGCGSSGSTGGSGNTSKSTSSNSNSSSSSNTSAKSSSSNQTANITFAWWTNPVRTKLTKEVVALFERKYPNVHVTLEPYPWSGYWSKLATQIAGGSEPDVMQMDVSRLKEYVNNGRLADLKKLGLDVTNIPSVAVQEGTLNGKLYAIPNGINTILLLYNPAIVKKAGVAFPADSSGNYTWSQLATWAEQIHQKTGGWGTSNMAWFLDGFQFYAKGQGDNLWSSDGKSLAVSKAVVTKWFQYWLDLQNKGATPPAGVTEANANSNQFAQNPFVEQKNASISTWLGEGQAYESALNKPVTREPWPGMTNSNKPLLVKPSQYWSVSSTTKYPKAAAELVNFLENNAQAAKILGYNRGVTVNSKALKSVEQNANATMQVQGKIMLEVEKNGSPLPVPPSTTAKVTTMFKNIAFEVLYKKKTPSQAAAEFIKQANQYMANN